MYTVYDIKGKAHSLTDDPAFDYAEVLDEGLTDDDYQEAKLVQLVFTDGSVIICNPQAPENLPVYETILDMFECM